MKTLWMMVGAPGCGKSWIAKNLLMKDASWDYVSRDEVRFSIITDEDDYFGKENIVFAKYVQAIKKSFNQDDVENVIADATHLNWPSRRKLINALKSNIDIIPVVISAPIEEILKNNDERTGRSRVPRSVVRRMNAQMTDPITDPYHYADIKYIDNIRGETND